MASSMERQEAIRAFLYAQGFADVHELATALGASLATVRRDLQSLEDQGIIDRVHGGARIARGSSTEVAFEQRVQAHVEAKRAIAALAAQRIVPRSTIFLDAGTTVLQLAKLLRLAPVPLRVFTNSLAVAQELMPVSAIETALLGGQLRHENVSTVGPEAEAMIERLWFDQLFIGASAIGRDGAIYSVDAAEASLNRHMLRRAADTLLLVDASKFSTTATFRVGAIRSMTVITDSALSDDWRQRLERDRVETLIAPRGDQA